MQQKPLPRGVKLLQTLATVGYYALGNDCNKSNKFMKQILPALLTKKERERKACVFQAIRSKGKKR